MKFSFFRRLQKFFFFLSLVGFFATALYFLFTPNHVDAAWYSTGWKFREKITIDESKVTGGSNLTNFPVLVKLTSTNLRLYTQDTGNDILFTSSDGSTKVNHEIEKFTQSTGELIAWVQIPSLSYNTNTVMYMYYGNSNASNQQNAAAVWDANYHGVWHLSESNGTRLDSTSNNNDLSDNNGVALGIGPTGPAGVFNDSSNTYLSIADASQTGLDITGNMTIEGWFYRTATGTTHNIAAKSDNATNISYRMHISSTDGGRFAQYGDGITSDTVSAASALNTNTWYHLAGVYDGTTQNIYLNGTSDGSRSYSGGSFSGSGDFNIGAEAGTNQFDGRLDEIRISNTNRSADWLQTEYNNVSNPNTFYTVSDQEWGANINTLKWSFDEGYGSAVNDNTVENNSGTISGALWRTNTECYVGNCLWFDGFDDYVSRTYSADQDLEPGADSFSASARFKHPLSAGTTDVLLSRWGNGGYILYMNTSGNICFGIDDDGASFPEDQACSTTTYNDSNWHFVEVVKSGTSSITLYIDSQQVAQDASLSSTGSLTGSNAPFLVGAEPGPNSHWHGWIDEVRLYNYAKSAAEVNIDQTNATFESGVSAFMGADQSSLQLTNGLIGYWPMDESTANTCPSALDSCDYFGNGNSLDWINDTAPTSGRFGNGTVYDGTNDSARSAGGLLGGQNIPRWAVSAWFKTSDTQGYIFDARSSGSGHGGALYSDGTNTLKTFYYNDFAIKDYTYDIAALDNTWHHAVLTRDGGNSITLYIDGQKKTPSAITTDDDITSKATDILDSISFGNRHAGDIYPLNGSIDDGRLYKRALSAADVRALYEWAPGPLVYFPLDEGAGTSVYDRSGNGNSGAFVNGATWISGPYGKALSFEHDNHQSVAFTPVASFPDVMNEITVSGWYRQRSGDGSRAITNNGGDVDLEIFGADSNDLTVHIYNGSAVSCSDGSQDTFSDSNWHYITMTYDGTTLKGFVDGGQICSATTSGSISGLSDEWRIGGRTGLTNEVDGDIDDVRIYNYAQTAKQIVSDMNVGHPSVGSPIASAMGHWKFDEGTGATANNSGSSGSILNGTLSSMASPATATSGWSNDGKFSKALNFDNDNDVVSMGSDAVIDNLPALTVSAWVYPRSSGENNVGRIFDKSNGPNTAGWAFLMDSNNLNFSVTYSSTPQTIITSATVPSDTWSYVAATWDGTISNTGVAIYINGIKQTSLIQDDSGSGTRNDDAANNLLIGNTPGGIRTFDGLIDEAKLYNYVLSEDEVKVDMNQGKSAVMGSLSTDSSGAVASSSSSREYCVPGDTSTCNAPVAEWQLDEKTGTLIHDTTGNNNNLSTQGGPPWAGGYNGSAINLDGINDYACSDTDSNGACDSDTDLQFSGSMSASFWMNADTIGNTERMIHEGDNTENQVDNTQYALIWDTTSGNDLQYTHETGAGVNSTINFDTNLSAGVWYHVTLTRNISTNEVSLYINGRLISTGTYTNDPNGGASGKFALGMQYGASGFFDGKIDQVRLYNYTRTPAQVAWDYNRGGPVGWWKFDECSGTVAHDSSGNAWDGTIAMTGTGTITSAGTCNSGTASESWNAGTTGRINSSLGFDGNSGDEINVGDHDILQQMTIAAWVYSNSITTADGIIGKRNSTENAGNWLLRLDSNTATGIPKLVVWDGLGSNRTASGTTAFTAGNWNHVAVTFDDTINTVAFYINGVFSNSVNTMSFDLADNADAIRIGWGNQSSSTQSWNGQIDDVRLYNYVLTSAQIKTLFNGGAAVNFAPLQGP